MPNNTSVIPVPYPASGTVPNIIRLPSGYGPLNSEGMQLANLALWHLNRIGNTGYLATSPESHTVQPETLGTIGNPAATQRRVWLDEPPGTVPFDEQASYPLTVGIGLANVNYPVLTVVVPQGFDGVIKWLSNNFVSTTTPPEQYQPGALIWRIYINGRPARNFGNITQEKGTVAQGRIISPIRVFSGDTVQYTVAFGPNGSILDGYTVVSLTGYYYPSRGVS